MLSRLVSRLSYGLDEDIDHIPADPRIEAIEYRVQAAGSGWVGVADYVLCSRGDGQLDASMVVWVRGAAHQPSLD